MAFAWDIFAEEIGKVGEGLAGGIRQRGINKAAEERALRMFEEKQKIEQPFKDLDSARILERQKAIQAEGVELRKGLEIWQGELTRSLNIFAGSEGYQKAIEKARKDGGLPQVVIMQMEDVIMRLHAGEVPPDKDMAVFEALDPFDRIQVMDLFQQNKMIQTQTAQKQQMLDREDMELQNEMDTRGRGLVDVKRGLDITTKLETNVQNAEKEFHKHRSELMNDLVKADVINKKGQLKVKLRRDKFFSLVDTKTGEIDQEVLGMLLEKYPVYTHRFQRLIQLQGNVMKHHMIRDQFTAEKPTGTSNTWIGSDGKTYETGKVYTIGGKKVRAIGENQFEEVK